MNYLFLGIFIIGSLIHLYASFIKNKPLRNATKGWLLLSLMGYYVATVSSPNWIILLALFFGWLGDVLLIPNGTKWFAMGGVAFMVGHIFFVIAYASTFPYEAVSIWFYILMGLIDIAAVYIIFLKLKPRLPKPLFWPMLVYLLVNGAMNCFAWYRVYALNASLPSLITALGALLFFISDSCLFFVRFSKNSENKSHFTIMITYLLAEFLILFGLIM